MFDKVKKTILVYDMLSKGDSILIALSGGPDSVALLYILRKLMAQYRLKLFIGHLNHGLRGKEATRDEGFCKNLGKKLDIPVFTDRVDVRKREGKSIEDLGRRERYKFLEKVAQRVGATKIALGHTADDQVETVLMRLIRGAGTRGLSGIPPKRKLPSGVWIVRPLVNIWKKEILKFLKDTGVKFIEDSTNIKLDFLRNRIRHELIPLLSKYNPNIKSVIQSTGSNLRLIDDYIKGIVEEEFKASTKLCKGEISITCNRFNSYHPAIRQLLVCRIIKEINSMVTMEALNVRKVISLALSDNGSKTIHLPRGIWIRREYNKLVFSNIKKATDKKYSRKLVINGKTCIAKHKILVMSKLTRVNGGKSAAIKRKTSGLSKIFQKKGLSFEVELDYDSLNRPVVVRSRKPGDVFHPIGMKGTKKVKDIFIDEKVPRIYRNKVPILASGNQICWIVGYRIGERFKVRPSTKRILRIKVGV